MSIHGYGSSRGGGVGGDRAIIDRMFLFVRSLIALLCAMIDAAGGGNGDGVGGDRAITDRGFLVRSLIAFLCAITDRDR